MEQKEKLVLKKILTGLLVATAVIGMIGTTAWLLKEFINANSDSNPVCLGCGDHIENGHVISPTGDDTGYAD